MTAIETLLRQPAAQAVGWALLQFVWQGAAVGALTALALLALRRSASDVRYVVSAIGLALMLTLPVVSGVQKWQALRAGASAASDAAAPSAVQAEGRASAVDLSAGVRPAPDRRETAGMGSASAVSRAIASMRVERLVPTLILIWIAGVSLLSLRLLTGWIWVQRLRARGNAPAAEAWQRMATRLSRRLHISRAITLLESTLVDVPTVIGWLKPVVLLPASALAALSPQQLEAILAHELAHIRRHDYLVNLLQTLVETLLFYHPAVWWLSRRIRIERENCCDDLAVSLCGDPVAYASALADLESLRSETGPTHHIAMAATGGSLLQRIRRLLGAPSSHSGRGPAWLAGSVALLLIGGIALGADGLGRDQVSARPAKAVVAQAVSSTDATAPVVAPARAPGHRRATRAGPGRHRGRQGARARREPMVAAIAPAPGPSQNVSISHSSDDQSGSWSWSNNGEKLQVSYSGTFEFTDDDTDVRQLSAGGYLKISDGAWLFGRHSVEIRERGGQMDRRYFVNASERPYEPDGRVWLRENLPKFVRNTGIGAPARVARFLKSGGVAAVMGEISRIDGAYVKGIYYKELFRQATLTPDQYRQAMTQASREMKSDYELAQLLISIADRLPNDEASRDAYFTAAAGISSDYELRRVYSTMLKRGPVSPQTLSGILDALGDHRVRLRAVGTAAPDHVAADARRPEPRGVFQERVDPEQRLRAASRVERGGLPFARSRDDRGRARPGREHRQRLRSRDVPAGGPQVERHRGGRAGAVLQGRGPHELRLRERPPAAGRGQEARRQRRHAPRSAPREPRDERLRAVAAADDGGRGASLDRRSPRGVSRRRRSPLGLRPEPGARGVGEKRTAAVDPGQVCVCDHFGARSGPGPPCLQTQT